ncbi:hypothetical protein [Rhodoferax sp.]|uniref:hypothetical protein n=1 Tax=Rhodoferax sp. TaxID=50421 RepID=UPI002852AA43|nr:hypothetical protein [Rhodoferax sp.]
MHFRDLCYVLKGAGKVRITDPNTGKSFYMNLSDFKPAPITPPEIVQEAIKSAKVQVEKKVISKSAKVPIAKQKVAQTPVPVAEQQVAKLPEEDSPWRWFKKQPESYIFLSEAPSIEKGCEGQNEASEQNLVLDKWIWIRHLCYVVDKSGKVKVTDPAKMMFFDTFTLNASDFTRIPTNAEQAQIEQQQRANQWAQNIRSAQQQNNERAAYQPTWQPRQNTYQNFDQENQMADLQARQRQLEIQQQEADAENRMRLQRIQDDYDAQQLHRDIWQQ